MKTNLYGEKAPIIDAFSINKMQYFCTDKNIITSASAPHTLPLPSYPLE
ncbi:MAG: hypothetical protein GX236_09690 [Clostridiaceae bacterium]|jgi:hypothetical protein|nr:hypothetical protein [Clostridiaceae bacterium]